MPNYQKTVIYKIYCKDANITEFYIGHTTNFISRRDTHKSSCNNEKSKKYNMKLYIYIRNNGGWDNWDMIEIEKYQCNDINEAKNRERYYIELLKSSLNYKIPNRTAKEYRIDNIQKEKDREYKKERIEYKKQPIKCECGCEVRKDGIPRHRKSAKHQNLISLLLVDKDGNNN